jgi:hypothetical protein
MTFFLVPMWGAICGLQTSSHPSWSSRAQKNRVRNRAKDAASESTELKHRLIFKVPNIIPQRMITKPMVHEHRV